MFKKGPGARRRIMEGMNQTSTIYVYMEMSQQNLLYNYHILLKEKKKRKW
jgi:hypothetical protein